MCSAANYLCRNYKAMHHFSKQVSKRMWYHIALSLGSALVTVALFDTLCSLSWLCKDYEVVAHYTGEEDSTTPIYIMDIIYWIFVSYRMVLSTVICVGGIFMGRGIIVIAWLVLSLCIDLIHLSETTYILSRPNLVRAWPVLVAVASCIWQELKIIRIKYRIIRRILLVKISCNYDDHEYEPGKLHRDFGDPCGSDGNIRFRIMNLSTSVSVDTPSDSCSNLSLVCLPFGNMYSNAKPIKTSEDSFEMPTVASKADHNNKDDMSHWFTSNAVHFIKLLRNLYNLLTWHFTGYLFGGDYQHLLNSNNTAALLEESFVRYARVFLDALAVIYIVQEKKFLLTPWIMAYIMTVSASITLFLFTLLYFNLLTTLLASVYYIVFSIDLFFRFSFLLFCIRFVLETKNVI